LIAILKLLRLPNVFTAVADVAMGFLVTHGKLEPLGMFVVLVAASCQLYLAGMVLNDVFDVQVDAIERPGRPIPSGQVPLRTAKALGWGLLASGVFFGWLTTFLTSDWRPGTVATALALCVVLYDRTLKRTPLAPLFMGACRTLNVLLGMSLAPRAWSTVELVIAIGIGVYIVGVTFFARTEARASSRVRLAAGTIVLLAGMGIVASLPNWFPPEGDYGLYMPVRYWYYFWALLAALIAWRCIAAVVEPSPSRVQMAVRNAVQSIIVLDAAVCLGLAGQIWGMAILLLLLPTAFLTQWLKST